jgi:protoheme IX farnesyltransferase
VKIKARLKSYVELMKLRVVELLLISTIPAMALAERGLPPLGITVATLFGGTLAAGSANAFNQVIEKDIDQLIAKKTELQQLIDEIMEEVESADIFMEKQPSVC